MPCRYIVTVVAFSLMAIAALQSPSVLHAQTDTLMKLDGSRVAGKLTGMTPESVEMEVRKSPTTFATREIDHIKFFDQARRTEQARDYIDDKQFELAARELSTMKEEWAKARKVTAVEGMYLLAEVKTELALAGVEGHSLSDAASIVRDVMKNGDQHYRFYPAKLLFARLYKAANSLELSEKEFAALINVADQRISLDANLELGYIYLAQKKFNEAVTAFDKAEGIDASDPESTKKKTIAKMFAQVARAGQGNADQAIAAIQSTLNDQSPDDAFVNGYAYNALGNAYLLANKPKEAEVAFLHTELLFPSNSDAHAEALYHLVQIWQTMGKADRVSEGRDKLMTQYGGTYWTARLNAK